MLFCNIIILSLIPFLANGYCNDECRKVKTIIITKKMYSSKNPKGIIFKPGNYENLNLVEGNQLKVLVHDVGSNETCFNKLREEYLKRNNVNVLILEYKLPKEIELDILQRKLQLVSIFSGELISDIINKTTIKHEDIHIIGHGRGGNLGLAIGEVIKDITGKKIDRITNLDPPEEMEIQEKIEDDFIEQKIEFLYDYKPEESYFKRPTNDLGGAYGGGSNVAISDPFGIYRNFKKRSLSRLFPFRTSKISKARKFRKPRGLNTNEEVLVFEDFKDFNYTKLEQKGAEFIDTVYTYYGDNENIADVTFYINGGKEQPNCPDDVVDDVVCPHNLAIDYFTRSLNEKLGAKKCFSYQDFKDGFCDSFFIVYMGENLKRNVPGSFMIDLI